MFCNTESYRDKLTAISVPLLHVSVLILEDQRQRVKIAVQLRTMDR